MFSVDFEGKVNLKALCLTVFRKLLRFFAIDHAVLTVILSF